MKEAIRWTCPICKSVNTHHDRFTKCDTCTESVILLDFDSVILQSDLYIILHSYHDMEQTLTFMYDKINRLEDNQEP